MLLVHALLHLAMFCVFLVKDVDVLLSLKLHFPSVNLLVRLALSFGLQSASQHVKVLLGISFDLQKHVSFILLQVPE